MCTDPGTTPSRRRASRERVSTITASPAHASAGVSRVTLAPARPRRPRSWSPLIAAIVTTLALVSAARSAPPEAGVLVPGRSLGGAELGWTKAQVEAVWGRAYGRCRSCRQETLYFNRFAFRAEGAGVELRAGRVAAIFTLWAPQWSTTRGLRVGDPAIRVNGIYGALPRVECFGYAALLLPGRTSRSAIYLVDREVWGFGLQRANLPVCR
jgi:hypothetical protein